MEDFRDQLSFRSVVSDARDFQLMCFAQTHSDRQFVYILVKPSIWHRILVRQLKK